MSESEKTSGRASDAERVDRRRGSVATTRRRFLAAGATASALSLGGCLGDSSGRDGDTGGSTDADGGTDASPGGVRTGTASSTDYPDEVVIGSNHPLTGATSYQGERLHNAVKLAAAIENENGGIESMDGATVRVATGDHKNDPTLGGEVAKELVDEGADVLTGCFSSSVTSAAATAAEAQGVPFVIDVAVAASVLQERQFDYVYRVMPNSETMARNCVDHTLTAAAAADYEVETAALFYLDGTYGQSVRDGLRTVLDEAGVDLVAEKSIAYGETADTQVTAFRKADPDVLVPTVFTSQFRELTSSMKDQNYWPPILAAAASSGANPTNYEKVGPRINGMLSTGYEVDRTDPRAEEISQRYVETYDAEPIGTSAAMAFATGRVIIEAFEQAGSADSEALNETLQDIEVSDHVMAMPPVTFDERGENANALATTKQAQDLRNQIVYPEQFATGEVDTDTLVSN